MPPPEPHHPTTMNNQDHIAACRLNTSWYHTIKPPPVPPSSSVLYPPCHPPLSANLQPSSLTATTAFNVVDHRVPVRTTDLPHHRPKRGRDGEEKGKREREREKTPGEIKRRGGKWMGVACNLDIRVCTKNPLFLHIPISRFPARPPRASVQGQRPSRERFATPPIVNESFAAAAKVEE